MSNNATTTAKVCAALMIQDRALAMIAAFNDKNANEHLEKTGSYSYFDEPCAVKIAREAIKQVNALSDQ